MNLDQLNRLIYNDKLNTLSNRESNKTVESAAIEIKQFLDLELDICGWYALGHHSPDDFLAVILERDSVDLFHVRNVKQGWAKFDGNRFEFVTPPLQGFQPITVLESVI